MIQRNMEIGQNIMAVEKYMKIYLKKAIAPYDLNSAEGLVLLVLYGKQGQTQNEILSGLHPSDIGTTHEWILDTLHYDKGAMSRTLQSLESKGLIQRKGNEADGRSYLFYLTHKAESIRKPVMDILIRWSDHVLGDLTEDELAVVSEILCGMAQKSRSLAEE